MEVDCPSTIGQPSLLQNTFFALRGSSNPILQENSKQFSRKQRYASLVQILSCESDPSIVNKILVWRYGYKIHEKISGEMNPPMGEPKNPFNMFTGRPFSVVVKEVGGYNNFDSCQFFDLSLPDSAMRMVMPNAQGVSQIYSVTMDTISTPEGKQMVFDYLKNNAPSLEPYEYHAWTPEVEEFVNTCIKIYSNPQQTVNAVAAAQNPGMNMNLGGMTTQGPAATPQTMGVFPATNTVPTSMPTMPTMPAAPSMLTAPTIPAPAAPTMPTAPTIPAPAAPTMPTMPTMGLDANAVTQVDPRGFNNNEISADVEALLNQPTKPVTQQPTMGLDLADVLNGTMM